MKQLLDSAHMSILLESPELLMDLFADRESLRIDRIRNYIDAVINGGLLVSASDVRRYNRLTQFDEDFLRLLLHDRLKLLHFVVNLCPANNDLSFLESSVAAMSAVDRVENIKKSLLQGMGPLGSKSIEVVDLAGSKVFRPYQILDRFILDCETETGATLPASNVGVRAFARSPFLDDSMKIFSGTSKLETGLVALEITTVSWLSSLANLGSLAVSAATKMYRWWADTPPFVFMLLSAIESTDNSRNRSPQQLQEVIVKTLLLGTSMKTFNGSLHRRMFNLLKSRWNDSRKRAMKSDDYHSNLLVIVEACGSVESEQHDVKLPLLGEGSMHCIEDKIVSHLKNLNVLNSVVGLDDSMEQAEIDGLAKKILQNGYTTTNNTCFLKYLRAINALHNLRSCMSSTYVICIVGNCGHGKSTTVANVFGQPAKYGNSADDRTLDAQTYYIPVAGDGQVQHLLIMDIPGFDESTEGHTSVFQIEAFQIADLIVMANKQSRAATTGSKCLLREIIHATGSIRPAQAGYRHVCNWRKSESWMRPDSSPRATAVTKLAVLMTQADDQLDKRESSLDAIRANAIKNANDSRTELREQVISSEVGCHPLDEAAFISCCLLPSRDMDYTHSSVHSVVNAKLIYDVTATRNFLADMMPPEVGNCVRKLVEAPGRQTNLDWTPSDPVSEEPLEDF
jgi:predicted GTPase